MAASVTLNSVEWEQSLLQLLDLGKFAKNRFEQIKPYAIGITYLV